MPIACKYYFIYKNRTIEPIHSIFKYKILKIKKLIASRKKS